MGIGFFDSGIGGLTVLKEALTQMPHEDYIYYADTLHVPYGTKPKEEVRSYIFEAADFMTEKGIKALVVACNTATSIAISDLRQKYSFPIIGMEPAVKPAVEKSNHKRVLVAATPLTLKEEKFHNLVSRVDVENLVDFLPLPELVDFAERFIFDEQMILTYLKKKLSPFDMGKFGTIVLGCTHFPFYRSVFKKLLPESTCIIDGSAGTVKRLKSILEEKGMCSCKNSSGRIDFYSSGRKEKDASRFMKYLELLDQV